MKVKPDLSGVPETALWTLWFRAVASRRDDSLFEDPMAVGIVERIDYPFAERFGKGFQLQPQIQALRVLTFDAQVRQFLRKHPKGTVVALGEGLETQFWRVDNGSVNWLTVDLPDSVALRRRLLPMGERQEVFAGSALDPKWTEMVDPAHGVIITAQGLLMYLQPERVREIISLCANAFPGGTMVFDSLPPWMAKAVLRVTGPFRPRRFRGHSGPGRCAASRSSTRRSRRSSTCARRKAPVCSAGSPPGCATSPSSGPTAR
ncbi:MAG TPA: class I SAM-dependent methyltransferase [Gemmatimonadales bacterium]|nr:class I SAM-dependent methyltransferase [Gemmatimonadales bacterium]